jgi:hypothetical protein
MSIPLPGFKEVAPAVLPAILKTRRRSERIIDLEDPEVDELILNKNQRQDEMEAEGLTPTLEVTIVFVTGTLVDCKIVVTRFQLAQ